MYSIPPLMRHFVTSRTWLSLVCLTRLVIHHFLSPQLKHNEVLFFNNLSYFLKQPLAPTVHLVEYLGWVHAIVCYDPGHIYQSL